ncbi:hypothetical protein TRIATDRAFT_298942 [Trichoderma atroviride IMI 206040]|uniref:Uncharacterized protein n=1 Tax=Hypocrea atroviridis (strain ATCC 20476 / IMI 206040) TaxID=452589 RepID=G9NQD0_HYPAI|nr:uncharacterized protein TRIATDRAFT_298942 [Trichoderma atroviride IMI 206040]EHK47274.1 hypothetical protein TRIATDRAFT_298942 [Trichoderma atroviride IMI 206040]
MVSEILELIINYGLCIGFFSSPSLFLLVAKGIDNTCVARQCRKLGVFALSRLGKAKKKTPLKILARVWGNNRRSLIFFFS